MPRELNTVPDGAIILPLTYNDFTAAYYAPFQVGTPPQTEYLKVDTGSPTLSFLDPRSSFCEQSNRPCMTYGTFDNETSSTCRYQGTGFADELEDFGSGVYLRDTVTLQGITTEHVDFGYLTSYGNPSGIIDPAATIAGFATNYPPEKGPYLLAQLKNASTINRRSVSVYLGNDTGTSGASQIILGGFYDKAKMASKPFTVEMVNPNSQTLANGETNSVNVTQIEVVVNGKTTTFNPGPSPDIGQPTLLDTGNPLWILPTPVFAAVAAGLGNSTARNYTGVGFVDVDCKYRSPKHANGHVTTTFGSAGKIEVPLHSLVEKFSGGNCGAHIFEIDVGNGTTAFGAPFLRSAYAIFDQEALTISIAQVKHTHEEHIVALPEGGF
ncbi:acid protease [Aureobasidium namibiae CBS 147.97]|uniref:Acid protease n=1 Tax=Aureobasidium namibiae CBS 147.97 TaxID=1043004 RepID=A0A074X2Q5_9PEZI|nr:acid protease [Aureobasidium namibiae CBS 147.97]KEQ68926.1 acid protease [Aureobasidium namibiae CBS 147.97]